MIPPPPSTIILTAINLNEAECWRRPWLKVMPVLWQIFPRLPIKMPQPLHVSWIHISFRANWTKNHQIAPSCFIARVQRPTCTHVHEYAIKHHDIICMIFCVCFFILFVERHTEHATTVYVWIRSLLFCIIYTAKPHAKTLCAGLSIQIWTPPLNPWHYA